MLFHGMYGNLFLSRFATGELDAEGKDRGVKSAMVVWQSDLSRFDADVIRHAAERCKAEHVKFPPTLPEFLEICRSLQPRRASVQTQATIGMSDDLKSSYTAKARAMAMARYRANVAAEVGIVRVDNGVRGILQLVASAVALAGGDEAAVLLRIERETAPRATKMTGTA